MPNKRRDNGAGSIEARGEDTWRLRYRVGVERFTKTVKGSKGDAVKELRRLLHDGDTDHMSPPKDDGRHLD
jgi:integrase